MLIFPLISLYRNGSLPQFIYRTIRLFKYTIMVVGGASALYLTSRYVARRYISYSAGSIPTSQRALVDFLMHHRKMITNVRVAKAMSTTDRKHFLPSNIKNIYEDVPQPIGFNATLSAPHMAGLMLDFLADHLTEGSIALDIGSGSGYISACMAKMVGINGRVVGVDHIQELVDTSVENITSALNSTKDSKLLSIISMNVGDGFKGHAQNAPYNCIYVGAAASELPSELVNQLKVGGRMVIPVGPSNLFHELLIVDKLPDGSIKVSPRGTVRFVPLTSKQEQLNPANVANATKVIQLNGQKCLVRAEFIPAPDSADYKAYEQKYNQGINKVSAKQA
ncbi:hypothetical protein SAMD00019534_109840, partial [Acytostelium subglobosum LB1]|uniref:hypothetical protein n=1 Tax=Acytostelium subglobosum LB1 TaxID=1410327 RepID=UPI000644D0BE